MPSFFLHCFYLPPIFPPLNRPPCITPSVIMSLTFITTLKYFLLSLFFLKVSLAFLQRRFFPVLEAFELNPRIYSNIPSLPLLRFFPSSLSISGRLVLSRVLFPVVSCLVGVFICCLGATGESKERTAVRGASSLLEILTLLN